MPLLPCSSDEMIILALAKDSRCACNCLEADFAKCFYEVSLEGFNLLNLRGCWHSDSAICVR